MPPKPIETNYDSKFEQIFDTFTGCGTTISDWKVYSTDFKSAIDIFYLGTAAVEHVNKLMKKLDGYDKLTVDDHNSLLETGWEELIVLHSAMVTSESGVFFNVKVKRERNNLILSIKDGLKTLDIIERKNLIHKLRIFVLGQPKCDSSHSNQNTGTNRQLALPNSTANNHVVSSTVEIRQDIYGDYVWNQLLQSLKDVVTDRSSVWNDEVSFWSDKTCVRDFCYFVSWLL